jgi:hypothetical protein
MKFSLVVLAALGATLCIEQPAEADWCAQYNYGGGATNCGFRTHQQCLAAVRGVGGSCSPSPHSQRPDYQGYRSGHPY